MSAISASMTKLLRHTVPNAWTEIQHQEDMNKCLRHAVKSGRWHTQIHNGHIQNYAKVELVKIKGFIAIRQFLQVSCSSTGYCGGSWGSEVQHTDLSPIKTFCIQH